MENILASMKIPIIEATTLDKPIALNFAELVSEMWLVLLSKTLTKLTMEIKLPRILTGGIFVTSLFPIRSMVNMNLP